jgi:hypothetical protein
VVFILIGPSRTLILPILSRLKIEGLDVMKTNVRIKAEINCSRANTIKLFNAVF